MNKNRYDNQENHSNSFEPEPTQKTNQISGVTCAEHTDYSTTLADNHDEQSIKCVHTEGRQPDFWDIRDNNYSNAW